MGNSLTAKRNVVLQRNPGDTPGLYNKDKIDFPSRYYIGLYGFAGVGKTSLINSMLYAVEGKLRKELRLEVATPGTQGTHTLRRTPVQLSNHIVIVDNRGLTPENWRSQETKDEIRFQIGKLTYIISVRIDDFCEWQELHTFQRI